MFATCATIDCIGWQDFVEKKEFEVEKGTGTPLGEIPYLVDKASLSTYGEQYSPKLLSHALLHSINRYGA